MGAMRSATDHKSARIGTGVPQTTVGGNYGTTETDTPRLLGRQRCYRRSGSSRTERMQL